MNTANTGVRPYFACNSMAFGSFALHLKSEGIEAALRWHLHYKITEGTFEPSRREMAMHGQSIGCLPADPSRSVTEDTKEKSPQSWGFLFRVSSTIHKLGIWGCGMPADSYWYQDKVGYGRRMVVYHSEKIPRHIYSGLKQLLVLAGKENLIDGCHLISHYIVTR